jgi:acetylglutamate kinase
MGHKNLDLVWDNIARIKAQESATTQKDRLSPHDILINGLSKLASIQGETLVIKLPCDVISSHEKLTKFAADVALLKSLDMSIIIIHEYDDIMPEILDFFGIKERFAEISKVMDYNAMHIAEMLVSGYINKKIVSALNAAGASAVGISGKDCNLIKAKKCNVAAKRAHKNQQQIIDIGFVGEPALVNPEILIDMESCDIVTVLSPVACGDNGDSFLLDANLTAAIISSAISASRLFILRSKGGLKKDDELIKELTFEELRSLKNDINFNKEEYLDIIDTSISAIENYTEHVHVIDSNIDHGILLHLFSDDLTIGTLISMLSEQNESN